MKFIKQYIKIEFKRAYLAFPKMLIGAFVLILIISSLAYCGEKLLYANNEHDKARIALVIEDKSSLISMATTLLESSESISIVANFIKVSPTVAKRLMDNKEVIATITVHEGFVDGLMHGKNIPIDIEFSRTMHSFTGIFKELSLTATQTMASTESGIYAQHDMYYAHNKKDKLEEANKGLNASYLNFVFSRDSLFNITNVSSTGNVSVLTYYLSGGLILFFMMFSMAFSSFIMDDNSVLKRKLYATKLTVYGYFISKIIVVFSMYYTIFMIFSIGGLFFNIRIINLAIYMIPVLLCMSCIVILLFEIAPNRLTGIILIFVLSIGSAILSGCIVPVSYLPNTLRSIGSFLPTTAMIDTIAGGLELGTNYYSLIYLFLTIIISYFLTILSEKVRCKE